MILTHLLNEPSNALIDNRQGYRQLNFFGHCSLYSFYLAAWTNSALRC